MYGKGITQNLLAEKLLMSNGTVGNKLRGVTPWTLEEAIKVKAILEYPGTVEELFVKSSGRR